MNNEHQNVIERIKKVEQMLGINSNSSNNTNGPTLIEQIVQELNKVKNEITATNTNNLLYSINEYNHNNIVRDLINQDKLYTINFRKFYDQCGGDYRDYYRKVKFEFSHVDLFSINLKIPLTLDSQYYEDEPNHSDGGSVIVPPSNGYNLNNRNHNSSVRGNSTTSSSYYKKGLYLTKDSEIFNGLFWRYDETPLISDIIYLGRSFGDLGDGSGSDNKLLWIKKCGPNTISFIINDFEKFKKKGVKVRYNSSYHYDFRIANTIEFIPVSGNLEKTLTVDVTEKFRDTSI